MVKNFVGKHPDADKQLKVSADEAFQALVQEGIQKPTEQQIYAKRQELSATLRNQQKPGADALNRYNQLKDDFAKYKESAQ